MPRYEEDEYEGIKARDYFGSALSTAGAGAAAGSAFGAPGAIAGGVIGGVTGIVDTAMQNRQLREAFEQQQALEADLDAAGADAESFMQDQAIASMKLGQQAGNEAAMSARAVGMNPYETQQLKQAAMTDAQMGALSSQGQKMQAAMAAQRSAQQGVLEQYQTAQALQNDAMGPGLSEAFSAAAGQAAQLGTIKGQAPAQSAAKTEAPADATQINTQGIAPQVPIPEQPARTVQAPSRAQYSTQAFESSIKSGELDSATAAIFLSNNPELARQYGLDQEEIRILGQMDADMLLWLLGTEDE